MAAEEVPETYMQLATVDVRVLKSELLLRPIWHHYSGRTQCMCSSACWRMRCGRRSITWPNSPAVMTEIPSPHPARGQAAPRPRPITPEVILRHAR